MAKKKASTAAGEQPRGRGSKQAKVLSPADLHEMAAVLRSLAGDVGQFAHDLEELDVKSFRALIGNWDNGIGMLRKWVNSQLIPVVLRSGSEKGKVYTLKEQQ